MLRHPALPCKALRSCIAGVCISPGWALQWGLWDFAMGFVGFFSGVCSGVWFRSWECAAQELHWEQRGREKSLLRNQHCHPPSAFCCLSQAQQLQLGDLSRLPKSSALELQ